MLNNKKIKIIITEIFNRGGKLNTSLAFITQLCFPVPKIKFDTLVYQENSKLTLTSRNCI